MFGLQGLRLKIIVSEPWDFGDIQGCGPFVGEVLKEHDSGDGKECEAVLIKLEKPLTYKDSKCEYFVGAPRHEGSALTDLLNGATITCGLTHISEDSANSDNPFDLSQWRGGIGLIGDLTKE